MAQLTINDIDVNLGSAKIVLSKSAYSFSDWLVKQITFSERVRIPESNELNGLFLRPKSPEITGQKFSKYYSFTYKDAGKIVFSGTAILLGVNESNQYESQLLDSSKELFADMKNLLNKLDLESSDFIFNSSAYTTLKVLNSSVWIWSAASMHELKTLSKNILSGELAFSRPFFSVQRLLEKIFSVNNWTYENSVNSEFINKLIISSNSDSFVFTSYEKLFDEDIVVSGSQLIDLSGPDFLKTDTISGIDTLQLNFTSKIRFRGYIDSDIDMILQISGVSSGATDSQTQIFQINKGRFFYDITSNEFKTVDATYNLQFTLINSGTATLENFLIYTIIKENDFGAMSSKGFVDFKVKTYDNLPNIKQIDLFKHALINVAGFFTSDNFRQKIKINSMNELSKLGALNWSDKLNEDTISAIPLSSYGKINNYDYDNDKEKPSTLGRGSFDIDNETLPDLITVYKSIFAASSEVEITDNQIDLEIYDDTERIAELNNIIGYYEDISTYTVARFNDLNGNVLFVNFYLDFISAIQNGEIIEAEFDLNKSDFFLFDFTQLIYLEQLKSTFYVLPIENYSEGNTSKVTLLKA